MYDLSARISSHRFSCRPWREFIGLMLDRQPGVDYASWPGRCGTWLCAGFFAINLQQKTKRNAYEYKNGEIIIIGGRADLGFNSVVAGGVCH
jgi:hypothetical protein